ncbi:MAG: Gfo/Idh/MocA family oxidoreductase [Capsulimonadales bacterium]|nr:Gfo/Idh/MocA family oxidoreductase [Capsulimonadales bacterium]
MSDNHTPLRWGILGAGGIATRFSNDVKNLADHRLIAVGSRGSEKAHTFADKYDIPNRHDSYEALANDPEVDVVYVATPHNFHREHTLLALNAGKAVLCEKPFTINLAETEVLLRTAREKSLFLMEGMWTRCFPVMVKARELVAAGEIGKPRQLIADFGFKAGATTDEGKLTGYNPGGRLFDPALGGGALMDVGVYPVSLANMFFGEPDTVLGTAKLGDTGVDENSGMLLRFPGGEIGILSTSIQVTTSWTATLLGTDGKIEFPSPWWCPKKLTVHRNGKDPETLEFPFEGGGFQYEAMHVADCLRAGKTESDIIPHRDTVAVMRTLDALRAQMGIKYPME